MSIKIVASFCSNSVWILTPCKILSLFRIMIKFWVKAFKFENIIHQSHIIKRIKMKVFQKGDIFELSGSLKILNIFYIQCFIFNCPNLLLNIPKNQQTRSSRMCFKAFQTTNPINDTPEQAKFFLLKQMFLEIRDYTVLKPEWLYFGI